MSIYVNKRPGVDEFIKKMSDLYELVVFTASLDKYANPLLDRLDIDHHISHRLFRNNCTLVDNGFIKDLSQFAEI